MASENTQCSTWCRFWILKIFCKVGVLKQSQSALFCSITHIAILFVFTCMMNCMKSIDSGVCHHLWSSGSSPAHHRPAFEAHPGANTFPSARGLTTTSFTDPSASRNTFSVSTITDGNAQIRGPQHTFLPLRWSDCTLSRLRAEEYDRPVTQSIATPEPSSRTIPTLDRTLVAARALSVSPHSGADGLIQGGLPATSPECWPFSPASPFTWAHFQDRWGLSYPYHVAATYPYGQPGSSSFASRWRFLPRRLDGTTAGC